VQLGNRDARHSQYSNANKKNSVPLKEALTARSAKTSRASRDDANVRVHHDDRDACIIIIVMRRFCRKCLRCSDFCDSHSLHSSRDESSREWRNVVNGAAHGLES
jgi:polyferredoxin